MNFESGSNDFCNNDGLNIAETDSFILRNDYGLQLFSQSNRDKLISNFESDIITENLVSSASTHSFSTTSLGADLIIQNPLAPNTVAVGSTIQLNYQLRNQGTTSAGWSETWFYLSRDANLSSDDIYLGYDLNWSLGAGTSVSETASVTIGSNVAAGNYFLLYRADGYREVTESNENNNIAARAISITPASRPDLVIKNATAPTTAAAGSTINLSYQLRNQGNGNASWSDTKFYLSKDNKLSSDDVFLGDDFNLSLSAGAFNSETASVSIGSNITTGNYFLLFQADGYGYITESNETNNVASPAITITRSNSGGYSSVNGYGLINAASAVAKGINQNTFADVANLGGNNWGADLIKAPEVWAKGYTGQGVVVAVLDTGVDRNHSDLSANIWKNTKEIAGNGIDDDGNGYADDVFGWNTVNNNNSTLDVQGHGTHVAGTIAGVRNSFGVTGIAYNAKIMPVKVLGDDGYGSFSGIAKGIRYAADNGAHVINMSLGASVGNSELEAAVQYAHNKGVVVVMAAGNDGGLQPGFPARYADRWGIAVGAVDINKSMASFSNRAGSNLALAYVTAPGVNIYSTLPGNSYVSYSGTSMATPHVAGVAALMLSANRNLTPAQVRQILTQTAENSNPSGVKTGINKINSFSNPGSQFAFSNLHTHSSFTSQVLSSQVNNSFQGQTLNGSSSNNMALASIIDGLFHRSDDWWNSVSKYDQDSSWEFVNGDKTLEGLWKLWF